MTRKEYIEIFGEDPVELFGSDWENEVERFCPECDAKEEKHYSSCKQYE